MAAIWASIAARETQKNNGAASAQTPMVMLKMPLIDQKSNMTGMATRAVETAATSNP